MSRSGCRMPGRRTCRPGRADDPVDGEAGGATAVSAAPPGLVQLRRRRAALAGRGNRRRRQGRPRRNPRPLRADQAVGRHPHRRAAADVDGRADRGGPQGKPHRLRRHQEAGPDLQDSQGAGEAQRADVRRGDAGGPARRLRLPPQPRLSLSLLPRRHLRLAQPDSPLRAEDRGHGFGPDPPAEGERALFRPAARRGDQLPGPQPAGRQDLLRRTDAAAPRHAHPHGNHARRGRDAGGRPDRAHRLRAAGADRQPAAGRQDDPHAEDGQGRAEELPGPLRLHAPDRRAAGRSHRHGAAR